MIENYPRGRCADKTCAACPGSHSPIFSGFVEGGWGMEEAWRERQQPQEKVWGIKARTGAGAAEGSELSEGDRRCWSVTEKTQCKRMAAFSARYSCLNAPYNWSVVPFCDTLSTRSLGFARGPSSSLVRCHATGSKLIFSYLNAGFFRPAGPPSAQCVPEVVWWTDWHPPSGGATGTSRHYPQAAQTLEGQGLTRLNTLTNCVSSLEVYIWCCITLIGLRSAQPV